MVWFGLEGGPVRRSEAAGTDGSVLTEAAIRRVVTPESFRRGQELLAEHQQKYKLVPLLRALLA